MKKYNIEPARLKGLLKSAEQDLGLSSEEAAKHVAKTISQETVNTKFKAYGYKKDPVSKLHHQEQAFITENRIRADLGYWAKYPSWTQIEAVYLMRGLDFNKILMDKNILTTASRYNYPTFNEIQQTNELAQRFILEGKMNVREHPIVWIHWAGENDLPVATSLEDLVLEYHKGQMTTETRQKYDTQLESELFNAPITDVKPKFIHIPLTSTYGYLPFLDAILAKACEAGETLPEPEDVYDLLVKQKPNKITFNEENKTLLYLNRDGRQSRIVNLKAIKKAIEKRTSQL